MEEPRRVGDVDTYPLLLEQQQVIDEDLDGAERGASVQDPESRPRVRGAGDGRLRLLAGPPRLRRVCGEDPRRPRGRRRRFRPRSLQQRRRDGRVRPPGAEEGPGVPHVDVADRILRHSEARQVPRHDRGHQQQRRQQRRPGHAIRS